MRKTLSDKKFHEEETRVLYIYIYYTKHEYNRKRKTQTVYNLNLFLNILTQNYDKENNQ